MIPRPGCRGTEHELPEFSLQPALLVAGLINELSETGGGRQRKAGTTCREGRSRAENCRFSEERPERQRERQRERELEPGPSPQREWAGLAGEEEAEAALSQ